MDDEKLTDEELKEILKKAKIYRRVTGADQRTEISLVFQEKDYEPIRKLLNE